MLSCGVGDIFQAVEVEETLDNLPESAAEVLRDAGHGE